MMMMKMKSPVILVVCTLLFSPLAVLASQTSFRPEVCCFNFYNKLLPKNKVVSYHYTHSQCAKDAVLFTMKNGVEICANPTQDWVQNIINIVNSRTKVEASGSSGTI